MVAYVEQVTAEIEVYLPAWPYNPHEAPVSPELVPVAFGQRN